MGLVSKILNKDGDIIGLTESDVISSNTNVGEVIYAASVTQNSALTYMCLSNGLSLKTGMLYDPDTYSATGAVSYTIPENYIIAYKKENASYNSLCISNAVPNGYEQATIVPIIANINSVPHRVSRIKDLLFTSNLKLGVFSNLENYNGSQSIEGSTPLVAGVQSYPINTDDDGYLYNIAAYDAFRNGSIAISPELKVLEYSDYYNLFNSTFSSKYFPDSKGWNNPGIYGLNFMSGLPRSIVGNTYIGHIAVFLSEKINSGMRNFYFMYDNSNREILAYLQDPTAMGYIKMKYTPINLSNCQELPPPKVITVESTSRYKIVNDGALYNMVGNMTAYYNMATHINEMKIVQDGTLI